MQKQNEHFHYILLFHLRKGKNASQARKRLCAVCDDEALEKRQCQNWFAKFPSDDFSKDEQRSGRPGEVDDDQIKAIIDTDRYSATREIAEKI
ncbi:Histone-lysine N-methyltransferase SETMAR, partial [Harpegnathos saltator]